MTTPAGDRKLVSYEVPTNLSVAAGESACAPAKKDLSVKQIKETNLRKEAFTRFFEDTYSGHTTVFKRGELSYHQIAALWGVISNKVSFEQEPYLNSLYGDLSFMQLKERVKIIKLFPQEGKVGLPLKVWLTASRFDDIELEAEAEYKKVAQGVPLETFDIHKYASMMSLSKPLSEMKAVTQGNEGANADKAKSNSF